MVHFLELHIGFGAKPQLRWIQLLRLGVVAVRISAAARFELIFQWQAVFLNIRHVSQLSFFFSLCQSHLLADSALMGLRHSEGY